MVDAVTVAPGQDEDALDPRLGRGRDPAHVLGDQRAGAANLPEHRAALDGVDPHGGLVQSGRGRREQHEAEGHERERDESGGAEHDALVTPLPSL